MVANTARLSIVWSLDGADQAVNVVHFDSNGDAVNQAYVDNGVLVAVTNAWNGGVRASICDNYTLARITVRDLNLPNQPEYTATVGTAGTATQDVLPLSTSMCITLRTALAGRRYRGRFYLSGFGEGSNTATGTIVAGSATNGLDFVQTLHDELKLGTGPMTPGDGLVIYSRTGGFTTPVTSIVVRDTVWDTQRRRARPGI